MLKYLIVLLDDTSIPFCHYENGNRSVRPISLGNLTKAIRFGMKHNLMIQFVFPEYELPTEYYRIIESIDHVKIKPVKISSKQDIAVVDISTVNDFESKADTIVIRSYISDIDSKIDLIVNCARKYKRTNIILKDLENITEFDVNKYNKFLSSLIDKIIPHCISNSILPQINILTDRITLDNMNNCNAGTESITIAPDGKCYICPGFYYDGDEGSEFNESSFEIVNSHLYSLDYAPICRICDAFQCHRCIWINKKKTLEVNTPGHIQCVISHIERNASRKLLLELKDKDITTSYEEIPPIDYLDPFEKIPGI